MLCGGHRSSSAVVSQELFALFSETRVSVGLKFTKYVSLVGVCVPNVGVTGMCYHAQLFAWVLQVKLRPSYCVTSTSPTELSSYPPNSSCFKQVNDLAFKHIHIYLWSHAANYKQPAWAANWTCLLELESIFISQNMGLLFRPVVCLKLHE